MPREKAQVVQTARPKVPMRRLGADCFVVLLKRGNARGAKGAGHRHLARVNRQREEPDVQWKAAAFARWHEPDDARVSSPVVCPVKASVFSRRQTCPGKSQAPRSTDSRVAGITATICRCRLESSKNPRTGAS